MVFLKLAYLTLRVSFYPRKIEAKPLLPKAGLQTTARLPAKSSQALVVLLKSLKWKEIHNHHHGPQPELTEQGLGVGLLKFHPTAASWSSSAGASSAHSGASGKVLTPPVQDQSLSAFPKL